ANGKLIKSCFRSYQNVKASYIAHSEFLRDPRKAYRYGFLFRLDPKNYKAWARGLKKAGYATSATYADGLIRMIERYDLDQYDKMSSANIDPGAPPVLRSGAVFRNNDVRMILTRGGETVQEIANQYDVKAKCIIYYNELLTSKNTKLAKDTRIYIQKKKKSYRGKKKYHYVKKGETMYSIAQDYGIRLGRLHRRNRLKEGTQPAVGARLKIRGWKIRKRDTPKTRSAVVEKENEEEFIFEEPLPVSDDPIETLDPPASATPEFYTVQAGDTLYGIARKFETTVEQIQKLNNLKSSGISKGQLLQVK
ncbi:MAG: LysM peptidoglycan-binding domain-containing protein, partial [Saprospiraceae bacterium]